MAIEVRIPSGSKLGTNFPPIEVMEIGQPGLPGELIIHNGKLWVYGANGETYIDGGLIQTDAILAGSITADKLVIGAQNFTHDLVWTPVDEDSMSWAAGTLKTSDGELHTIDAGSFNSIFDEQSSGPNNPATGAADSDIGDITWTNPTNIYANDGSDASVTLSGSNIITYYLKATNFSFAIPSNRKILGIKVEVEMAQANSSPDFARDYRVRIIKGGVIRSANKALMTSIPTTDTYREYGGASDLWGEQWTPDDINDTDFGVAIAFEGDDGGGTLGVDVTVDHIRITVYYGKVAYIYYDGTTTLKSTNDETEVVGDDVLLLAVVEKGGSGGKIIINPINSAGTTIDGNKIVTGRIQSSDGKTYFDLNEGRLIVNDGTDDVILVGKKSV